MYIAQHRKPKVRNYNAPVIYKLMTQERVETMHSKRTKYSYFEKDCRKKVHATIPKGNMGYDQYTVPDDCSCRTYFCCFALAIANTIPWPFVPILSNFFEKKRTQNHPQCLSGLSRALFPTTFLEIAVYNNFLFWLRLRQTRPKPIMKKAVHLQLLRRWTKSYGGLLWSFKSNLFGSLADFSGFPCFYPEISGFSSIFFFTKLAES